MAAVLKDRGLARSAPQGDRYSEEEHAKQLNTEIESPIDEASLLRMKEEYEKSKEEYEKSAVGASDPELTERLRKRRDLRMRLWEEQAEEWLWGRDLKALRATDAELEQMGWKDFSAHTKSDLEADKKNAGQKSINVAPRKELIQAKARSNPVLPSKEVQLAPKGRHTFEKNAYTAGHSHRVDLELDMSRFIVNVEWPNQPTLTSSYAREDIQPESVPETVESPTIELDQAVAQLKASLKAAQESYKTHKAIAQYQKAVLDVLEHTSQLAEEIITPKAIDLVANNGVTPLRSAIYKVFERTRRLLGRDSEAVILEDTSEYFRRLASQKLVDLSSCTTVRGSSSQNPFEWVNKQVIPLLDVDMKVFVAPVQKGVDSWIVTHPKPYFHLQKRLYERLFSRSARSK